MGDGPHFRRSKRQAVAVPVTFRRDTADSVLEHQGETRNLAVTGAFVETEHPPPEGTILQVQLPAPTAWDPLELRARVEWTARVRRPSSDAAPPGCGIRFIDVSAEAATALHELVEACSYAAEIPDSEPPPRAPSDPPEAAG